MGRACCTVGCAAMRQAPRLLRPALARDRVNPSLRRALKRPSLVCQRCQPEAFSDVAPNPWLSTEDRLALFAEPVVPPPAFHIIAPSISQLTLNFPLVPSGSTRVTAMLLDFTFTRTLVLHSWPLRQFVFLRPTVCLRLFSASTAGSPPCRSATVAFIGSGRLLPFDKFSFIPGTRVRPSGRPEGGIVWIAARRRGHLFARP